MPDSQNSNLLGTWINEANKKMSKQEIDHAELRIDFTKLDTRIRTRNGVIWATIGLFLTCLGLFIP